MQVLTVYSLVTQPEVSKSNCVSLQMLASTYNMWMVLLGTYIFKFSFIAALQVVVISHKWRKSPTMAMRISKGRRMPMLLTVTL